MKNLLNLVVYFFTNSLPEIKKFIETLKYLDISIKRFKLGSRFPFS